MRLVTDVWVPGIPRPKGSMKPLGPDPRMVPWDYDPKTKRSASRDWAALITRQVASDLGRRYAGEGRPIVPRNRGVSVDALFFVPLPSVADRQVVAEAAIDEGIGDVDKLVRNVLDALKGARAYVDDVQVERALGERVYATGDWRPGVHIIAIEHEPAESKHQRRRAEMIARRAFERAVYGVVVDGPSPGALGY